jgi:hypothetical protein
MSSTEKKSGFFDKLKSVFLGPEEQAYHERNASDNKDSKESTAPVQQPAASVFTAPKSKKDDTLKPMAVKKVIGYEDPFKEPTPEVMSSTPMVQEPIAESDLDITFAGTFYRSRG